MMACGQSFCRIERWNRNACGNNGCRKCNVCCSRCPATVDFDNVSGVTSLTSRGSSATLVVDDIQEIPTSISVNNNTAAQTFIFKDTAVSGNTDELTLKLDGVGGVVNVGSELDGDGDIEIFTIVASDGASDLGVGNGFGADAITITVTATSALDLGSTRAIHCFYQLSMLRILRLLSLLCSLPKQQPVKQTSQ